MHKILEEISLMGIVPVVKSMTPKMLLLFQRHYATADFHALK